MYANMDDLISVIVPAYNIEKHIERCLESICRQTYKHLEIIVVNDGSTDTTGSVIEKYANLDSRIVYIHKENGGVTLARLEGILRANGDYIGFVDGDDVIDVDMYERLIYNAKKYNSQISHCGYKLCFADGRVHYFHNTGILVKHDKITAVKELLSGSMVEPGLGYKLFDRRLFDNMLNDCFIDASIKINEDLLMNFYLFSAAETSVFEDWCPYHYIVREGSTTRSKLTSNKIYDPIKVKNIIMSVAGDDLQKDAKRAYINTCISIYHMLLVQEANYRSDIHAIRKLLIRESNSFILLEKKRALMAWTLVRLPSLYRVIYYVYSKYLQKDIYC